MGNFFGNLFYPFWVTIKKSCYKNCLPGLSKELNKYETDPYFLQIFQSNTSVCLIISVFCKSCEPICEPEITPVLYHLENLQKSKQKQFHVQCSVHKSYKTRKWTSFCIGNFEVNMDLSRIYLAVPIPNLFIIWTSDFWGLWVIRNLTILLLYSETRINKFPKLLPIYIHTMCCTYF